MGSSPGSLGLKGTKPSSSKIGGESGGRFGGSGSGVGFGVGTTGAGSGVGVTGSGAGSGVGSGVGAGVGATGIGVGSGAAGVGAGVGVTGVGRVGRVSDSRGLAAVDLGFVAEPPVAAAGAPVLVEVPNASETGGCVLSPFFEPQFFGRIESSVLHELSAMASKPALAELRRMVVFMCVVWCFQPGGMDFD